MREHYALRLSRAAAAEDNGGECVDGQGSVLAARLFNHSHRSKEAEQGREPFVPSTDGFRQVFYPDDGRPSRQFQLGFLDKGTARDHGPQTRLPDRGFQTDAADRIVEVHAGFSAERRRNICKGASDTGRKQNADMTLALPRGT
jgi:hypothetical protein